MQKGLYKILNCYGAGDGGRGGGGGNRIKKRALQENT
jgi:hypothetical protein